jgi:hydroxyacylglutathione hydrolase
MVKAWPIPVFSDNYVWVLQSESRSTVALVDPGDAAPVLDVLAQRGLRPTAVLLTHHHSDHVGGVTRIVDRYPVPVFGPAAERIRGVDQPLRGGDTVSLSELELEVIEVPGHTAGHVAYLGPLFVLAGDTLFAGGCGRVFEGTMEQMHASLLRLAVLGPPTAVYCAHEYTLANLRFALEVEPENSELAARHSEAGRLRRGGVPTVPSTIDLELRTNPFLRCDEPTVMAAAERHAGRSLGDAAEVFGELRRWKDGFRG